MRTHNLEKITKQRPSIRPGCKIVFRVRLDAVCGFCRVPDYLVRAELVLARQTKPGGSLFTSS